MIPVINHDAVLAALTPADAIGLVRDAFVRHHRGEWQMPAKVYLPSPPYGDFRAMPARGGGIALLKWVSSFPGNGATGVPTVSGVVVLSDATTGAPLALIDARGVTALRTGAGCSRCGPGPRTTGCGDGRPDRVWSERRVDRPLHGGRRLRTWDLCRSRPEAARALADELGWEAGSTTDALGADIICCVTPGAEPVVGAGDLRPGIHLNMLGADGSGKAEATIDAVLGCQLFCDEWEQASHGGELAGAWAAGVVTRDQVTTLGAVLDGQSPGRTDRQAVTMFDSTGLAIQDLGVAAGVLGAWRDGRIDAQMVSI